MKDSIYCSKNNLTNCTEWRLEGSDLLHRENGPASISSEGTQWWYFYGQIHREGGPAVEFFDGTKTWFIKNKKHRLDGPAVEHSNGKVEYWLQNIQYSFEEWDRLRKLLWLF